MIDTSGHFAKGFDRDEAYSLLELCINLNNPNVPGYTWSAAGWTPVYPAAPDGDADAIGPWRNAWKLWKRAGADNTYALVVRGTITNNDSIIEDVITTSLSAPSAMIKAWDDGYLSIRLADADGAETHLGFTYGLAVLLFANDHGILRGLKANVPAGSKIYVAGHSQGAAVATLLHAFLHYAINDSGDRYGLRDSGYALKSYVFAQPKPGNAQFSMDFARIAGNKGTSFVVNNSRDWVTQVPLSQEFLDEPGADIASQLNSSNANVALRATFDLFRSGLNRVQSLRALVARASENISELKLQVWNRPASQMDVTYKIAGAPPFPSAQSVNFAAAGNVVPVFGYRPDNPDVTPNDPLYQHHLTTYRRLMHEQLDSQ